VRDAGFSYLEVGTFQSTTVIGRMQAARIQVVPLDQPRSLKLFAQTTRPSQLGCPRASGELRHSSRMPTLGGRPPLWFHMPVESSQTGRGSEVARSRSPAAPISAA
jgi:hypothetical protein